MFSLDSKYSYWVLIAITIINITNQWTRFLITYLASTTTGNCDDECNDISFTPICEDCDNDDDGDSCVLCHECRLEDGSEDYNILDGACLTENDYGVLVGYGYSITFCIVGLIAGRITDEFRIYIPKILTICAIGWNLMVVFESFCHSFGELLLTRSLLGLFQAFSAPCCYMLIGGYFSQENRSLANGIFAFGTYLGVGMSSLSILISLEWGWRETSLFIGLGGMAVSLIGGSSIKPPFLDDPIKDRDSIINIFFSKTIWNIFDLRITMESGLNTTFYWVVLAACIRMMGGYVIGTYLSIYFARAYPDDDNTFSYVNAISIAIGGSLSSYAGGWIGAYLARYRDISGLALVPYIGTFLGGLPFIICVLTTNFEFALTCLFFGYLFGECWMGPVVAIIQNQVAFSSQGRAISIYMFCITILGSSSPDIVAYFDPGTKAVRWVLAIFIFITYGLSGYLFGKIREKLIKESIYQTLDSSLPTDQWNYGGLKATNISVYNNNNNNNKNKSYKNQSTYGGTDTIDEEEEASLLAKEAVSL